MKYDISVILPAYNVAPYVKECLLSVFTQEFNGRYEVILIDDCSTDNTFDISAATMGNHKNGVLLRHKINQGCSAARNTGIEHASGEYIAFVDPDDILPPGTLQRLHSAAKAHNSDIVKGNHLVVSSRGTREAGQNTTKLRYYNEAEVLSALLAHEYVRGHPWGKLFKRSVINNIRFKKGVKMAEDFLFCAEVFSRAKSLTIIPEPVYYYQLRSDGSTGKKFKSNAYLDWIHSIESCETHLKNTKQRDFFNALLIRTLLQLVRETRQLERAQQTQILEVINQKILHRKLNRKLLFTRHRTDIKTQIRYLKILLTRHTINRSLKHG